jgi:hypothetical protein
VREYGEGTTMTANQRSGLSGGLQLAFAPAELIDQDVVQAQIPEGPSPKKNTTGSLRK